MWETLALWKKPKLVAVVAATAVLYFVVLMPLAGFKGFNGTVDLGRIGIVVPLIASVLFGPAAAWGAAFGNFLRDFAGNNVTTASVLGFIGNFLVGYVPYKLWRLLKAEKALLKLSSKTVLFIVVSLVACIVCGLIIGWDVYWVYGTPFGMIAFTVIVTNAVWAVTLGPLLFALLYGFVRRHSAFPETSQKTGRVSMWALVVMLAAILTFFIVCTWLPLDPVWLTPFALVMIGAVALI